MSSGEPLKSEYSKYVPKKTEYTAYGYTRRNQTSLNCIIAELVHRICLAFFAKYHIEILNSMLIHKQWRIDHSINGYQHLVR